MKDVVDRVAAYKFDSCPYCVVAINFVSKMYRDADKDAR